MSEETVKQGERLVSSECIAQFRKQALVSVEEKWPIMTYVDLSHDTIAVASIGARSDETLCLVDARSFPAQAYQANLASYFSKWTDHDGDHSLNVVNNIGGQYLVDLVTDRIQKILPSILLFSTPSIDTGMNGSRVVWNTRSRLFAAGQFLVHEMAAIDHLSVADTVKAETVETLAAQMEQLEWVKHARLTTPTFRSANRLDYSLAEAFAMALFSLKYKMGQRTRDREAEKNKK